MFVKVSDFLSTIPPRVWTNNCFAEVEGIANQDSLPRTRSAINPEMKPMKTSHLHQLTV